MTLRFVLILYAMACLGAPAPAGAQTPPTDLTELSLEELLKVNVTRPVADSEQPPGRRWLVGYRYVRKRFHGYQQGTRDLTFEQVLEQYPVVPEKIIQEAHFVEASYVPRRGPAVVLVVPYIRQQTDHLRRIGEPFTIRTEGVGDVSISASYRVRDRRPFGLTLHTGISLPTGSIDETGDTPRGRGTQVPYTMQLGSGTWDLEAGVAYAGETGRWSWGGQLTGTLRLGRNDHGYSLSDRLLASVWVDGFPDRRIQPSIKLSADVSGRIDGADPQLDPSLAPVADGHLYGGTRLDLVLGLKLLLFDRERHQHSIQIEGGVPIHQDLNGPQPEQDLQLGLAWSWRS